MKQPAKRITILILSVLMVMMFSFPLGAFAAAGTTQGDSEELVAPAGEVQATEASTGTDADTDPTTIDDPEIPLSVLPYETGWSIVSLCASILTIIIGVALVTMAMMRKGDEKEQSSNNFGLAVFSMVAAIVSTVLFTSTEEIHARMIVADSFTVAHLAILVVAVLCAFLSLKKDVRTSFSDNPPTSQ